MTENVHRRQETGSLRAPLRGLLGVVCGDDLGELSLSAGQVVGDSAAAGDIVVSARASIEDPSSILGLAVMIG